MASADSYSEKVIELHNKMVDKLGEEIVFGSDHWCRLLAKFNKIPLSTADKTKIKSMQDLFETLINKRYINYGDYGKFHQKLDGIHNLMATLVKECEKKIQNQITQDKQVSRKRSRSEEVKNEDKHELTDLTESPRKKKKASLKALHSTSPLTAEQKRQIHGEMVTKLSEELSEDTKTKWAIFQNYLRNYLGFGDAKLAEITDIFKACRAMEAKGKIDVCKGEYDMLRAVVKNVDKKLVDIITEHLQKMGIETSPRAEWRFTRSISARSTESCDSD